MNINLRQLVEQVSGDSKFHGQAQQTVAYAVYQDRTAKGQNGDSTSDWAKAAVMLNDTIEDYDIDGVSRW